MDDEKKELDQSIESARERVGDRIDELDRRIRRQLDVRTIAAEHATELVTGGAVVGFLVGFGFPKVINRVVQIAIPVAMFALRVKKMRGTRRA
ncbi:MAG TPA: hypothetical protein VLC46_05710 [Thermoanaerobaculia bacterium]|jgi:hypothetical protein|nr:hypothetical protein [Thermoanaerobaculia bacterium]